MSSSAANSPNRLVSPMQLDDRRSLRRFDLVPDLLILVAPRSPLPEVHLARRIPRCRAGSWPAPASCSPCALGLATMYPVTSDSIFCVNGCAAYSSQAYAASRFWAPDVSTQWSAHAVVPSLGISSAAGNFADPQLVGHERPTLAEHDLPALEELRHVARRRPVLPDPRPKLQHLGLDLCRGPHRTGCRAWPDPWDRPARGTAPPCTGWRCRPGARCGPCTGHPTARPTTRAWASPWSSRRSAGWDRRPTARRRSSRPLRATGSARKPDMRSPKLGRRVSIEWRRQPGLDDLR